MGPRNAYKDMLDKVVSPIACVSMNHQNQLVQMENGALFATPHCSPFSTAAPPPFFLITGDRTSRVSLVRGWAPLFVGGPQLQMKEGEPFVGVDLDPP
jgi:hypothetical protein